jgi:protein required for attachment to host cells
MEKTWILIADAHRARFLERHAPDHSLTELADFVFPHTDDVRQTHGRTGHAGTQLEPHTQTQAKERSSFAQQLADYLNAGVAEQRCKSFVLIASSPMLGELRPHLSSAAAKSLRRCVASDLTRYQGAELKERVNHALELPD